MRVLVLGLGKVGLPTAIHLAELGHRVFGYDVDPTKRARLHSGLSDLAWEPGVQTGLATLVVLNHIGDIGTPPDVVYVIVPTPMVQNVVGGGLSSEYVERALASVSDIGSRTIRIVGSTLEPAEADRLCGGTCVYSPPLIRLGHVIEDLQTPSVGLVGGTNQDAMDLAIQMWQWQSPTRIVRGNALSIATAKLAINVSLSLRIAWANEIDVVCRHLGASTETVLAAMSADPRIGARYLQPGWIPGGPCLPRDLTVWNKNLGSSISRRVAASHRETQERMLPVFVDRIDPGSRVAVLGLTYNARAADLTDSLGMAIARHLLDHGRRVVGYDPAVSLSGLYVPIPTVPTAAEAVDWADTVILTVPWPEFEWLSFRSKAVVDLRRPT